jgi:hypothetical protein
MHGLNFSFIGGLQIVDIRPAPAQEGRCASKKRFMRTAALPESGAPARPPFLYLYVKTFRTALYYSANCSTFVTRPKHGLLPRLLKHS